MKENIVKTITRYVYDVEVVIGGEVHTIDYESYDEIRSLRAMKYLLKRRCDHVLSYSLRSKVKEPRVITLSDFMKYSRPIKEKEN